MPHIPGWNTPFRVVSILRFLPFPDSASYISLLRAGLNQLLPLCPLWTLNLWKLSQKCTKSRHQQWLCVCMCAHAKVFVSQLHLYDQVSKRRNRNNWRSGNCRKRWHHVLLDDQKECNEPWSVQTSPREEKFVSLAWSQSSRQVQCYQTPSLYHS